MKTLKESIQESLITESKVLTFNTEREVKNYIKQNGKDHIINVNGIDFGKYNKLWEITNKIFSYYDPKTQSDQFFYSPFIITIE